MEEDVVESFVYLRDSVEEETETLIKLLNDAGITQEDVDRMISEVVKSAERIVIS